MKPNFNIVEGEPEDYWDDYEEFIQQWNNGEIKVKTIQKNLDLSQSKYRQYRDKGFAENRLDVDLRSPQKSVHRGQHTRTIITRSKE